MGLGGIGQKFIQTLSDAQEITKTAVTNRTQTARGISESFKDAKEVKTETSSSIFKFTSAFTGSIIGTALKPFVFNPEMARAELKSKGVGAEQWSINHSDDTIKALRDNIRAIEGGLKQLTNADDLKAKFATLKNAGGDWDKLRKEVADAVAAHTKALMDSAGLKF